MATEEKQEVDESLRARVAGEQIEAIAEELGGIVLMGQEELDALYEACQHYWREHPPTKP